MVNKCIAPNCNSGYQSNKSIEKVAKFKFPVDAERRKKWICAVPRKEWEPTKNSVLCEKHFLDSDFLINRDDKTRGRIQKRGELHRRKLKPTAIPSVWPNLPSHLKLYHVLSP